MLYFLPFVTALLLNCNLCLQIAYLSGKKYPNLFEMGKYPSKHRKFFLVRLYPWFLTVKLTLGLKLR